MKTLRRIALVLLCLSALFGSVHGAPSPDDPAGTLNVQLESILHCFPGSEACDLGSLCADAAVSAADAQLALVPAAVLKNDLPAGPLTWRDITNAVADEPLVACTLTPAQLFSLLEQSLSHIVIDAENEQLLPAQSQFDGFLQISGFSLTIDASAPVGERVYRVVLHDGTDLLRTDNRQLLRVATTASAADGTFGYSIPVQTEPLQTSLAQALANHCSTQYITTITTNRIQFIGTRDSALVNRLPGWALYAVLAILIICCIFFRGKERATKPFRPIREGETKQKF